MATKTKRLNLTLPAYEDAADVTTLNQNFEKLDESAARWGLEVAAAITTSGALELSGDLPAEKDGLTVQFLSPAAATDNLQVKFSGEETLYPVLSTSEGKEPVSAGAWDAGVPVTLTVSGGSCFFKGGGQGFPAGWNEKGQGIAWDDILKNSPIVQREYGKIEDGLQALPEPDILLTGTINSCSFSADGKYLATVSNLSPYLVLYKKIGESWEILPNPAVLPTGAGECCTFSRNGKHLAVAHNGYPYITIYKQNGDEFVKLANPNVLPTNVCRGCSFSPDGNYLAITGSGERQLLIYKITDDSFNKLTGPADITNGGYCCSFSKDGKYLAVSELLKIRIYKRNGDDFLLIDFPNNNSGVALGCDFSPENKYFAISTNETPYLMIYRIDGDIFTKMENCIKGEMPNSRCESCCFSPDGKYLIVTFEQYPYCIIYKIEKQIFQKIQIEISELNKKIYDCSFGMDGKYIVLSGYNFLKIYLNEDVTYVHTLNGMNKEYFAYAPKGKIGIAKETKAAGEQVKTTLFPALYNLPDNS